MHSVPGPGGRHYHVDRAAGPLARGYDALSARVSPTGIIILLVDIVSLSPRGRPLATNSDKALQRAADLLLFKLPPAAAVQSSGPDTNKSVNYLPAPALLAAARQNCRSNSAATVRLRASEL